MRKPKVGEVKQWQENEFIGNRFAKVYVADIDDCFLKVVGAGKTKYFYGETAWQDAQRLAGDIHAKVLYA